MNTQRGQRIKISLALLLILVFGFSGLAVSPTSAQAEKIIFGLDWAFVGQHAPFFTALDKGFFKEEGLEVEIVRGFGSADAVQKVATNAVTIGYGDTSSLAVARTQGVKVKLVGMILSRTPAAVIYRMDKALTKPAELEGKKIGAAAGDAVRRVFPAFAKVAGFDINKVEFVTIGYEVYAAQLLSGQIDALAEYNVAKPLYDKAAAENGLELGVMNFADYGLDVYSNGILVTEQLIAEKPDMLRKFLKGLYRGFAYAYDNIDEAVDIMLKYEPNLDKAVVKAQLLLDKESVLVPDVLEHGYGYISAEKMKSTLDVVAEAYELAQPPTVDEMYDTSFLPSMQDVPPPAMMEATATPGS